MKNKIIIIALFGPAGSGKDFIQNRSVEVLDLHKIISCTTRPRREGEVDGIAYHFLDIYDFALKVDKKEMLETTCFRDWYYGTSIDALSKDKINIGVFNIQGIKNLLKDSRLLVFPVFIQCADKIRLERQLDREKNPDCVEICRRFLTDKEDFKEINFNYTSIRNEGRVDEVDKMMKNLVKTVKSCYQNN